MSLNEDTATTADRGSTQELHFRPAAEREKFYLPNFIMDNLIVFGLCSVIAFVIPLMMSRRGKQLREGVATLYNDREAMQEFRNICMMIAAVIAVVICYSRLKKFHLYAFQLNGPILKLISYNQLGHSEVATIDLRKEAVRLESRKETKENSRRICMVKGRHKKEIFSTETSRYWHMLNDRRTLEALDEALARAQVPAGHQTQ